MPLMPKARKWLISAVLLLAMPCAAVAQQDSLSDGTAIRADDLRRLAGLNDSAGAALRQAFASGDQADLSRLAEVLAGTPLPASDARAAIPGAWSCQMIKLGGGLPIVIYQPFRCVATETGFEKLTGSQRTKGTLHLEGDQLIYLGTGFIAGDTPPPYVDLPDTPDPHKIPQRMPEVGVVELIAPDRGRIIFPQPYLESRMNLLVLQR